jgi:hypothetical protein
LVAAVSLPAAGADPGAAGTAAKKKCSKAKGKRAKGKKCKTKKKQPARTWGLSLTPTYLEFEPFPTGQISAPKALTLTNTGNTPSGSLSTYLNGPNHGDFQIVTNFCERVHIPAGGTCTVNARFAPTQPGVRSMTFSVIGTAGGTDISLLRGTGTP